MMMRHIVPPVMLSLQLFGDDTTVVFVAEYFVIRKIIPSSTTISLHRHWMLISCSNHSIPGTAFGYEKTTVRACEHCFIILQNREERLRNVQLSTKKAFLPENLSSDNIESGLVVFFLWLFLTFSLAIISEHSRNQFTDTLGNNNAKLCLAHRSCFSVGFVTNTTKEESVRADDGNPCPSFKYWCDRLK